MKIFGECSVCMSLGLLVLRAGFGCTMLFAHGMGKLLSYGEQAGQFPDPLHVGNENSMLLAIFAEFFCSILVVLGFATRLAVIPLITAMAVAALVIHAKDPWQVKEMAVLYLIVYVTLLVTGAGRFSVDGWLASRSVKKQASPAE